MDSLVILALIVGVIFLLLGCNLRSMYAIARNPDHPHYREAVVITTQAGGEKSLIRKGNVLIRFSVIFVITGTIIFLL